MREKYNGNIKGKMTYINEGAQLKVKINGKSMSYTFSNENKSFVDANGNALGDMDILEGQKFAVLGVGDKNVDGSTLHGNYFGTSMTGPDNPLTNDGTEEYYGNLPFQTNSETYSKTHDLDYNKRQASGVKGALIDPDVLGADIRLAGRNAINIFNPSITATERAQSIAVATSFSVISAAKIIMSPVIAPITTVSKANYPKRSK